MNNYLNFIKVQPIFLENAYKAVKAVLCWSVMSTVWRYGLKIKSKDQMQDEHILPVPEL